MPQIHHHQEDYGYNPQFFSASKEDFMSNLIGTNFQTPESAYVYMQSTPILSPKYSSSSSTNNFVKEKQPAIPN